VKRERAQVWVSNWDMYYVKHVDFTINRHIYIYTHELGLKKIGPMCHGSS
jgi:hypothetical protein